MTNSSADVRRGSNADTRFAELEHTVVGRGTFAECTIFPRECTDEEILTHWITAEADSFVSLEELR